MLDLTTGIRIGYTAKDWVKAKVPYRHRGTTRTGCDCTGLLIGVMNELGYLRNYKLRQYPVDWNLHSGAGEYVVNELMKLGEEIPKAETRIGDIVVFQFGRCISHAGIFLCDTNFAHSYRNAKHCCIDRLKNSLWSNRWMKSFRWNIDKINETN